MQRAEVRYLYMKAFRINVHTVAAIISREELCDLRSAARKAFLSLGESGDGRFDITSYAHGERVIMFATRECHTFGIIN